MPRPAANFRRARELPNRSGFEVIFYSHRLASGPTGAPTPLSSPPATLSKDPVRFGKAVRLLKASLELAQGMEIQRQGNLLTVDTLGASIVCDQCRKVRRKCSRGVPACDRCLKQGLVCTRHQNKLANNFVDGTTRACWALRTKKVVVSTSWAQAIESYPGLARTRFYLRGYVLPLAHLVPSAALLEEILKMAKAVIAAPPLSFESKVLLQLAYAADQLQHTFALATRTFFHMFNPFLPLFSEEGFHARPRSAALRRVVVQIGLERMPQTELTRTAMLENNFDPALLLRLPPCLDTLQCLLLAQFGVDYSYTKKFTFRMFCYANRMLPLLGLHINRSSQRLERTLAIHAEDLAFYHLSVGHLGIWVNLDWIDTPDRPPRLPTMALPHPSDTIHFVTSQAIYHCFSIVASVTKHHKHALKTRQPAHIFASKLAKYATMLDNSFRWGWQHLAHPSNKPLLVQSRLSLALRYCNNYLALMKMASHIPLNPRETIAQAPITNTFSPYAWQGLNMAIRTINLVSTLNPAAFGLDYVRIQIPSIAFIIARYRPLCNNFGCGESIHRILRRARANIQRGLAIPTLSVRARAYLDLIDFFMKKQSISVD